MSEVSEQATAVLTIALVAAKESAEGALQALSNKNDTELLASLEILARAAQDSLLTAYKETGVVSAGSAFTTEDTSG